jgi:hypothetical protein
MDARFELLLGTADSIYYLDFLSFDFTTWIIFSNRVLHSLFFNLIK